jgi:hypothetical protein
MSHPSQSNEESWKNKGLNFKIESETDEGFILRFGGRKYGIIPQYVKDNVLYWSRFNDNGTTTLFMISL